MPSVDDYDRDEENPGGGMGGGHSGGGGGELASATPQKESTFVPWSRFVSANESNSKRVGEGIGSSVKNEANDVSRRTREAGEAQASGINSNYQNPFGGGPDQLEPPPSQPKDDAASSSGSFGGWGSFGAQPQAEEPQVNESASLAKPQVRAVGSQAFGNLDPNRLTYDDKTGQVTGTGITGAKDLESQLGTDAWGKLLGDTAHASADANALGSEQGVQSLIQQQSAGPLAQGGAFDAALVNGANGQDFRRLNQLYGGDQLLGQVVGADKAAQDRWSKLMGDVDAASKGRQKTIDDASNPEPASEPAPAGQTSPSDAPTSIDDVLFGNGTVGAQFWSDFHQAGLSLSPADWATIGLGEAGIDSPMATEAFVTGATGALASQMKGAWPAAKVKWAFNMVDDQYDQDAMQALAQAFKSDPNMLQQYLSMNNPGFMARNMRAWLDSKGFKAHSSVNLNHNSKNDESHVNQYGNTGTSYVDQSGHTRTTNDSQEQSRTMAYRQGWGQSWDEQFNSGVDDPSQGGKPKSTTTSTEDEWDPDRDKYGST